VVGPADFSEISITYYYRVTTYLRIFTGHPDKGKVGWPGDRPLTVVYIDDIVVYLKTFEDHLIHLDKVLKAIIKANITLSPPKCHIGYQSLILLGQKVSRLGISTHKEKVDAIQALIPPNKVSELQSFLGMVNYFSNYIPFYSWITRPLYSLLRKDTIWIWNDKQQRAFDLCKEALTAAPVLGYPIPGLGY